MVALIGNPNSGKTTLFNALTGLRQKVANYPGVTVEKKEGRMALPDGSPTVIIDLPGTYSLTANSPDEQIAVDILLGRTHHTPRPQVVICVVDASNVERSLYLVSQLIDRQIPLIVALNMVDSAERIGTTVNARALAKELGVIVVPTIATKGEGIHELKSAIQETRKATGRGNQWRLPEPVEKETDELMALLHHHHGIHGFDAYDAAVGLLSAESIQLDEESRYADEIRKHVRRDHQKLEFLGFDRQSGLRRITLPMDPASVQRERGSARRTGEEPERQDRRGSHPSVLGNDVSSLESWRFCSSRFFPGHRRRWTGSMTDSMPSDQWLQR